MSVRHDLLAAALCTAGVLACSPPAAMPPAAQPSPEAPAVQPADPGVALREYLARTVPFGVSGAVLIARNDQVIVHDGFGLADREQRVPVKAETVFDIGSITKQFTAAAILKLEEQGRLRVEDSIGRFFAGVPANKRGITLHHLLTHTAGLIGDLGGDYQVMSRDSLVRLALASELQWAPGTRWDYSNLGYSLLGAIVELASGQPYERYLHEQLFRPVGMEKTGYRIPQWTPQELAVGYRGGQRWGTPLDHAWAEDGPWWNLRANGGILSTMDDLYRWHRALESDVVLAAASRQKLFTPHAAENPEGSSHYGYGWAVFTTPRNTRLIAHNGGNGYFFADFRRYVDENVVVILATNDASQGMEMVENRVLSALFSGRAPALPPASAAYLVPAELERYAGSYVLPSGARIVVSHADGQLSANPMGHEAAEVLAGSDTAALHALRDLNARAMTVLESARRKDFAALRTASASPGQSEATLQRIWRTAEQNMGPFRSLDVLGTVRSWWGGEPEPVTFVRLNFERGTRLFRLHWENGKISGYGGFAIPSPAPTTLLAQGDHRFIGYNLGIEREIRMRFEGEGDQPPSALVIETPAGELRAARGG
ncbi:MAG TPA: serine hydrolase domain-containing protein [Gemmatimonadaceae bacterium]|nr:serine hydrolase domain-containing protein [Gemmatimonadaceae bacterium]